MLRRADATATLLGPRALLLVGQVPPEAGAGFGGPIARAADDAALAALGPAPPGELAILGAPATPGLLSALAARGTRLALALDPAPLPLPAPLPVIGPESFGLMLPGRGLNTTPVAMAGKGGLALVGQSPGLIRTVLDWAPGQQLGFSAVLGLGQNQGLGFAFALDALSRDSATRAILLEVGEVKRRRAFFSALRAAARIRPVVALRRPAANEPADARAAFAAAVARAGALPVASLDALLAAAETLPRLRPMPAGTIAVVADDAGLARHVMQALAEARPPLPLGLPEGAATALSLLPDLAGAGASSPVIVPGTSPARLAEAAAALAALPGIGAILAVHAPAGEEADLMAAESLAAAARANPRAPLLACLPGGAPAAAARARLEAQGLPAFGAIGAAVQGLSDLLAHRRVRAARAELPTRDVVEIRADRIAATRVLDQARAERRETLTEDESLAVLAAYGVPTVPARSAAGPEDAACAADLLGYPVVLKIRSPDIPRKTEVGGVVTDLRDAAAVAEAARAMEASIARLLPGARRAGFLVQRQAERRGAQELRITMREDALAGPVLAFGLGGTAADLFADRVLGLPPLNLALAHAMIGQSRAFPLLQGYRDHPGVDIEAVAGVLVRISQLVVDLPQVAGIGLNPLLADRQGVLALDAEITLSPRPDPGRLALPPYPAELAGRVRLRDGREVLLRPIRPEDAEAHQEFFRALSPEDVRLRWFAPIAELSDAEVARLTAIDYEREMAFVAVDAAGATLGVARMIEDTALALPGEPAEAAEYAIAVRSGLKGLGLGRILMERLITHARARRLSRLDGSVLADNAGMLALNRKLGFTLRRDPDEPEVMQVSLALA